MKLVYFSLTNNTDRFVHKLNTDIPIVSIDEYDGLDSFILFTPTHFYGEPPTKVVKFLEEHGNNIVGVVSFGNKNWGDNIFAMSGKVIAQKYNVPWLHRIELSGTKEDVNKVNEILKGWE